MRDLADGGQNLVLTALVWTAIWLGTQKRLVPAGFALGLAVALKCTALIFVGWFMWKRQWRMASVALAAAVAFSLAPALWMGPVDYSRHMTQWSQAIRTGISQPDPSIGVLGPEPFQNDSLRPALARFVMKLPEGHPGRFESPWYRDFLNLTPQTAGIVIKIITALLGLALLWCLRGKLNAVSAPWQFASIGLFMLLLSPITWGQHCVAAWPALWLLTRELVERCRWKKCALIFAVLALLTNREFLGKPLSYLLASYHVTTLALLILLAITLADARRTARFEQEQDRE
jgi:alpha-1,2-mannosyltransferase